MIAAFIWLVLTVGIYGGIKRFYRRYPKVMFSPLLLVPIVMMVLLFATGLPYETYHTGAHWLSDMIGPATVALAVPLYKNIHVLKKHAVAIVSSVFLGSTVAILSSIWIAQKLGLTMDLISSLVPHSATTPIAMAASEMMGGIPSVAAVMVLVTGILGILVGPIVIRLFRIRNDIARGVLLGTGAHAAGTSKAFEFGTVTGSISSVAMILTAFFTLCTAPWLLQLLAF